MMLPILVFLARKAYIMIIESSPKNVKHGTDSFPVAFFFSVCYDKKNAN